MRVWGGVCWMRMEGSGCGSGRKGEGSNRYTSRVSWSMCRYHKIDDKLSGWKTKIEESQA